MSVARPSIDLWGTRAMMTPLFASFFMHACLLLSFYVCPCIGKIKVRIAQSYSFSVSYSTRKVSPCRAQSHLPQHGSRSLDHSRACISLKGVSDSSSRSNSDIGELDLMRGPVRWNYVSCANCDRYRYYRTWKGAPEHRVPVGRPRNERELVEDNFLREVF